MSKETLNAIKEEVETVNEKLQELTEEELTQVSAGAHGACCIAVAADSVDGLKVSGKGSVAGSDIDKVVGQRSSVMGASATDKIR